jgi:hypothetical protein
MELLFGLGIGIGLILALAAAWWACTADSP